MFEFCETRSGENVREFLKLDTPRAWQGTLVTDGFSGYTATTTKGVTSAQCMAHARRKFNDLWANHGSEVGRKALRYYQCLFRIEREIEELPSDERRRTRQRKSRRVLAIFHRWLLAQRQMVPPGSATMKAIDYSLKRWRELTRFVDDGDVPISNNWVENHIRPIAIGRANWLFSASVRAGKRAAAIMSLLHSARINGHEPYAYFKDMLERLPTHPGLEGCANPIYHSIRRPHLRHLKSDPFTQKFGHAPIWPLRPEAREPRPVSTTRRRNAATPGVPRDTAVASTHARRTTSRRGAPPSPVSSMAGGNLVPLCAFRDLANLKGQSLARIMNEAGQRCLGTTRLAPWSSLRWRVRIPLMADSDSIPIADSVPCDGGHLARVS